MPTTTVQGPGGSITLGQAMSAKLGTWSATLIIPTAPTTGFEDVGNETAEPLSVKMVGSAVGVIISGVPATPAAGLGATPDLTAYKGTVTLYGGTTSGNNYAFLGIINGVPLNRPCNGRYDVSFNFENSGPITKS